MNQSKNMEANVSKEKTNTETPEEAPKQIDQSQAPEGTVIVNKDKFDELMRRLDRVEYAADSNRLDRFDLNEQRPKFYTCLLSTWNGQVVVRWEKMKSNEAGRNAQGARYENLIVTVITEDGQKHDLSYVDWRDHRGHITVTIKEKTQKQNGEFEYLVVTDEGKEYKVFEKFVN